MEFQKKCTNLFVFSMKNKNAANKKLSPKSPGKGNSQPKTGVGESDILKMIGHNLQQCRIEQGLSLLMLEQNTGIDNSYLSKIEKGDHDIGIRTLIKLLKGLGVRPDAILTKEVLNKEC